MDSVGVNVIETAALGRPFQLGMLYDCRKDALITGVRLWNKDQLKQNISSHSQINTDFNVSTSDSLQDKSKLLNIDGGLKLSLLGDLIQVSGAAKYLKDTKSSFKQQRLTLHYHSTSRFEELVTNHLTSENIAPDDDSDIATHVVTGVLYGADACFVFDREVSSDEDKKTVKGELKVALEKLQSIISVGANADLSVNHNQKNTVKNFTCTFYGDFQLPSNPTSFEDALKVFAELPKLLKENQELAVPLRVWLYPLEKLNSRTSKLHKDISMDLIIKIESVIESLNKTEMKCRDLMEDSPAMTFDIFHDKIRKIKQNCYMYKLRLMKKLGSLLPNIRGDVMKETTLNELLQEHDASPFNDSDLVEWLKERERESEIIKSVLRRLKDAGAQVELNVDAVWMGLEDGNLVSYTFTSLDWADVLLSKQTGYLNPSTQDEKSPDEKSPDSKQKSWLTPNVIKFMRNNLEIFKSLTKSKDSCKPAKFIVSSREMENHPGSCILLYEHGCDEAVCFTPPSQPARPIIEEVKGQTVVLKVPPSCPATVELRLLYKAKQDTVWTSEPVLKDQLTLTLTDLRAETEYEIKCVVMGKLDYTRDSDVIHLRVIEKKLIMATDSVIENLSFTENKCSELLKDTRTNAFTAFRKKIEDLKRFCQIYRQDFNKRSQSLIRSVQACEEETCALTNLLQAHYESPFNTQDLMEWITGKEKEMNTVGEYLQQLLGSGAEVNMSLDTVLSDIKVENVVCYTFSSLEQPDELLSEQENYMKAQTTWKNPGTTPRTLTWLSGHIREKMRENVIIFKKLMTSHDNQSTKFIVSSKEIENNPGSCILLYEHGCDEAVCFTPPSQPARPITEEVKGQTVVLKVPPSCPATVELRLLYKPKQDTIWTSEPVLKNQHTVTLTDLRAETEYEIKCSALGKLDYTRDSDVIRVTTEQSTWNRAVKGNLHLTGKQKLNLVLCGCDETLKNSLFKLIQVEKMNPSHQNTSSEECVRRNVELYGRQISLLELPALSQLSEEEVKRHTLRCVSLCDPGVHAFLIVVPVGPLSDEDKAEIEKVLKIFDSKEHFILLFTSDFTADGFPLEFVKSSPETQRLISHCGGQYRVMGLKEPENSTQIPELLEYIEKMKTEPYSLQMYVKAQENRVRRETEERLSEMENKIRELEQKIQLHCAEGEADHQEGLRIVLIGRTGNGKSATGNTILGRKEFHSQLNTDSVTTVCQKAVGEVDGRSVTVVDTPGLFDTSLSNDQVMEEIMKCVSMSAPGPHVFVIVLTVGRFTREETETVDLIKKIFGHKSAQFSIILFTRGDDLEDESIEDYVRESYSAELKKLIRDCGNRFLAFNNREKRDRTQVIQLLKMIEEVKNSNEGQHFTNSMFEEAEMSIKKRMEEIMKEREREIQTQHETVRVKYETEMEELKKTLEEEKRKADEERKQREDAFRQKEEKLIKDFEEKQKIEEKKREIENEKRLEEEKQQRAEYDGKIVEMKKEIENQRSQYEKQQKEREEEDRKREEKYRQDQEKMKNEQERIINELRMKQEEEMKNKSLEERKTIEQEEKERQEWERKIKEAENDRKEIQEEIKRQLREWEDEKKQQMREREEEEEKRREKHEEQLREKQEELDKMRKRFDREREEESQKIEDERQKQRREREEKEKEYEEKKTEMKRHYEELERERKEQWGRRKREENERREEERKRWREMIEDLKREQDEEIKRREKEKERKENEERARDEMKQKHEEEIKVMKKRHEDEARKQAEELNDFRERKEQHVQELTEKLEERQKQQKLLEELYKRLQDQREGEEIKKLQEEVKNLCQSLREQKRKK